MSFFLDLAGKGLSLLFSLASETAMSGAIVPEYLFFLAHLNASR